MSCIGYYFDDLQLFEMGTMHLNRMGAVQLLEFGGAHFFKWSAVSIYAYVLYFPVENLAANLLHYHGFIIC